MNKDILLFVIFVVFVVASVGGMMALNYYARRSWRRQQDPQRGRQQLTHVISANRCRRLIAYGNHKKFLPIVLSFKAYSDSTIT